MVIVLQLDNYFRLKRWIIHIDDTEYIGILYFLFNENAFDITVNQVNRTHEIIETEIYITDEVLLKFKFVYIRGHNIYEQNIPL